MNQSSSCKRWKCDLCTLQQTKFSPHKQEQHLLSHINKKDERGNLHSVQSVFFQLMIFHYLKFFRSIGSFFSTNDFSPLEIAGYIGIFFPLMIFHYLKLPATQVFFLRLTIFHYLKFLRSIASFFSTNDFSLLEITSYISIFIPTYDFSLLEIASYIGIFFATKDFSLLEILEIYSHFFFE